MPYPSEEDSIKSFLPSSNRFQLGSTSKKDHLKCSYGSGTAQDHINMDPITPIIPHDSLKDTLAILVVLLSLPQPLSLVILSLYILFSSSKAFVSRLFTKLFKSAPSSSSSSSSAQSHPSSTIPSIAPTTEPPSQLFSQYGLIVLFDLAFGALLKSTAPNITKVVFVLSKSIIASSLSGGNQISESFYACLFVIILDHLFKLGVLYLDSHYGITISLNPYLFPYLSNVNLQFTSVLRNLFLILTNRKVFTSSSSSTSFFSHFNYTEFSIKFITYLINYFNLLLSIHVILVAFASRFKNNVISKIINQLSNELNNTTTSSQPTNNILLNNKDEQNKTVEVSLSEDLAKTPLPIEEEVKRGDDDAPASYPQTNVNIDDESVSSATIVAENFEIFVNSSFTKPKKSIKSTQPLWSLLSTAKAMSLRKDIYSGEVEINNDDNSLVLSDYVNKYDEYKFVNFEEDSNNYYNKKISIFINYIGETLISFQLKNHNQGLIIIRVNGVIWYQVSRGEYNGEEYFIVGGLTPSSQYDIQFIIEDEDPCGNKKKYLIDDLIVSTTDSNGSAKNNASKVLSPLITLQESLITTNDNLVKEKLKLKKTRKEISKKINSYKQDIEILKGKISNSDKNDEKNYKKVMSLRISVKQVEEDFTKIEQETSEIELRENEINEIYLVEKRKFETNSRNFTNFKNQFNDKLSIKRQTLSDLNSDIDFANSKKEKLINKLTKLQNDIVNIDKELEGIFKSDLSKRLNLRAKRKEKRSSLLNEFKKEIDKIENDALNLTKENEVLKNEALMRQ